MTPEALASDYLRACAVGWGLDPATLRGGVDIYCDCGCGSIRAITYSDNEREPLLSVAIPNHCKRAYDERVKECRIAAGFARTNPKRHHIKCQGITVQKTWNWTKHRDWEVRDSIRDLSRNWDELRPRLVNHARTLEQYARNPL